MTTLNSTWVLVADASRARLFRYDGSNAALQIVKEWDHPTSRLRNQDLISDRPGRVTQSRGQSRAGAYSEHGSKSGIEPDLPPKRLEHEHFARMLAAVLAKGLAQHLYGRLLLVASPEFLGILRQVLGAQVLKHVVASIGKNYSTLTSRELTQCLTPDIPP